ncbi:sulfatase-like hydrolase/transferase [Lentilitoribacter sp. EG35]|jgi:choline-sulfatase|uniref:sulfatase-like hydrolase/transferase n=1 Tax=Lentilitoribacter sp. EG35 TaxID=3234192 RepID=UPI00345FF465
MKRPNILFLFSDQHNQKMSGCYGDKVVQTPNIDRLAAEGVRFDNAYCPSPICVPSRMAMLTARWPSRQDCWVNDDILRSDLPTWLHAAGAKGYQTTLIGRLHAIGPDQLHGYGDRPVGDHSPNWPGGARQSLGVLEGTNDPTPESLEKAGAGYSAYQEKDEDVTTAAESWLKNEALALNSAGKPFCLTVGLMLPHPPYVVDQEAYKIYEGMVPPPEQKPVDDEHEFHAWWRKDRGIDTVTPEQTDRARTAYCGLVHRMDEMIGRVLDALEEAGLLDDTLIVYASDHGDHLGERGLWWKHTFFDESVKVPLVMRLPGVLPAGEVRKQVVNLVDLSQTMLEAMGASQLPHANGKSFWDVAKTPSAPWLNETFSEYCTDPVPHWTGARAVQQRMIRADNWKLCIYDSEAPQLFDLENDPLETTDLAALPEHREKLEALMQKLTQDWNPQDIVERMKTRRIEKDLLLEWAKNVQPVSSHIWTFSPGINRLE